MEFGCISALFEFSLLILFLLLSDCSLPKQSPDHACVFELLARRTESGLHQRAVQPPSMSSVSPVIREAAGEARNTTALATSIGSPMRPNAILDKTSARNASSARASAVPGVLMKVGATAFTVMLYC